MPNDDALFRVGHRERLRQKFLDGKLADYDLFELMLGYVIPRRDVRLLSRGLLAKYGCLSKVFTASFESLIETDGLGRNTAIFIKVIREIMMENYRQVLSTEPIFHNEQILKNYCRLAVDDKRVEEFHILYLDCDWRLVKDELHSSGTNTETGVYSREIVARAINLNARYVVLLHNHPLPNRSFSSDDIDTTMKLRSLMAQMGIVLHDHFVVSNGVVYSMREMHLLKDVGDVANNL